MLSTSSRGSEESELSLKNLSQSYKGFALKTALYDLLATSNEKQVQGLLEQSIAISRESIRESMQEIIVGRYAEVNPHNALSRVTMMSEDVREQLMMKIFEEWSQTSLDDAVSRGKSLDGLEKLAALQGILLARDDLSESSLLEIANQFGLEEFAHDIVAAKGNRVSKDLPEIAWTTILNDSQQNLFQLGDLFQIAKEWIELEGLEALEKIHTSITDPRIGRPILMAAVHDISLKDPQSTFEQALALDGDLGNFYGTGNYLVTTVVETWATTEPKVVLEQVEALDPSALRSHLLNSVVKSWGNTNPQTLLDNVEVLPSNLQLLGTETAIVSTARSAPEEAARLLSTLNVGSRLVPIAHSIATNWSNLDPEAALDWVKTNPDIAMAQSALLPVVLGNLAKSNPQRAIELALKQPIDLNQEGMEVAVIKHLSDSDPQQAAVLLSKVRSNADKLSAYTSVGANLTRKGDVDQALTLANHLLKSEKHSYFVSVVDTWAITYPEDLYNSLNSLPTKELRSHAAAKVLAANQVLRMLTDAEVESMIETFLSD